MNNDKENMYLSNENIIDTILSYPKVQNDDSVLRRNFDDDLDSGVDSGVDFDSGIGQATTKDTVFRKLFTDKEKLLNLYNAINNTNYTDTSLLEISTLDNAIYMNVNKVS